MLSADAIAAELESSCQRRRVAAAIVRRSTELDALLTIRPADGTGGAEITLEFYEDLPWLMVSIGRRPSIAVEVLTDDELEAKRSSSPSSKA